MVQSLLRVTILLLVITCVQSTSSVKIGVLLPYDPRRLFSVNHISPVLDYVTTYVRERGLLDGVQYELFYRDSRCNSKDAPIHAFDLHRSVHCDVIFGPVCDYSLAPVARYAPVWNVPIITPGGFAHDFGKNKRDPEAEYATLTRVGLTFNSLSVHIIHTLYHFNWTRVKLIYDVEAHNDVMPGLCFLAASSLIYYSKAVSLDYSFHLYIPGSHDNQHVLSEEVGTADSSE